ncbi:MAG: tyrosine-type recombinase/integrase [Rhodobacteraceae bacterium]|nr:tyrosine-type recombinase/integrase [Paracoccaceae bacterium]
MIHLRNREMLIPDQLNKKPWMLPLNAIAFRTAEKLCETAPGALFFWHRNTRQQNFGEPAPFTSFCGFFQNVRVRAGLTDVRFHDLKDMFASWWVQSGGDLLVLKDVLGHATLDMAQRYTRLNTAANRARWTSLSRTVSAHFRRRSRTVTTKLLQTKR